MAKLPVHVLAITELGPKTTQNNKENILIVKIFKLETTEFGIYN